MAVEIPQQYPTAEIDMFYCDPPVLLANGTAADKTEIHLGINGVEFQRWSRHRQDTKWIAGTDCVATHFGLIDQALCREVGA